MVAKVTVVITHYNDERLFDCLKSLYKQTRAPDQVIIADGGSDPELKSRIMKEIRDKKNYRFALLKGRCIDTRRKVIDSLVLNEKWIKNNYDTDIIAWIDSDEKAFNTWLEKLVAPIEKGEVDFAGGRIVANYYETNASRILCKIENKPKPDESYIAMGNSAWSTKIFKKIGSFDDSSITAQADKDNVLGSYHISDDYDINLRALKDGFKGKIVDSVTFHNQSHIDTYTKVLKYFYGQYVRTAMAYFKHKESVGKFSKASRNIKYPFELVLLLLKPIALIHGWKEWMILQKHIDIK